jgi:hypothetical protein
MDQTLTRAGRKLLDAAVQIWEEDPTEKDAAYLARQMVQATLPHKNPGNLPVWTRTNGNLTLAIQPGVDPRKGKVIGYPYGSIPRLLLFWITTEAVRIKARRIEFGRSLTAFMLALGLNPDNGGTGAKRSDARRLRDQMERLFQSRISFHEELSEKDRRAHMWLNMEVAPKGILWWDIHNPRQDTLWGSWIELGEDFFTAITSAPVPVDTRALKALKRSPLALDLYAWLTYESYRAHQSGKSRSVAWGLLHKQFGSDYTQLRNFQQAARKAIQKIRGVYPTLKLDVHRGGVCVTPDSLAALTPRPSTILDGVCTTL